MTTDITKHKIPNPPASAIKRAEDARSCWHNVAVAGATLEHVLAPSYLGARAKDVKPGDRFEIVHAEHKFFVEGYIRAADKDASALDYVVLRVIDLTQAERVLEDWSSATIAHEGEQHKWAVRVGGKIAKSGFEKEIAASEWLRAKRLLAEHA